MSPMGDSAGRSAGHRMGAGAKRRNTPRERADIDPPHMIQPFRPAAARTERWAAWGILVTFALIVLVAVLAVALT